MRLGAARVVGFAVVVVVVWGAGEGQVGVSRRRIYEGRSVKRLIKGCRGQTT